MKFTLLHSALVFSLAAFPCFCQMPTPAMLNVTRYQVKLDRIQEFLEVERQVAGSFKKAAPTDQFRVVYRDAVGNITEFWVLTPLSKLADRDGQNPYVKMTTEQERLTRTARLTQYIEHEQTSIDRPIADLTVAGTGPFPPTWVLYQRIRVHLGKANDFINIGKNDMSPAMKKINAAVRVRQTIFGGHPNEFTVAVGFEKWAELDNFTSSIRNAMGDEKYRGVQERMAAIEENVETSILRYQADLSYYPGASSTTTSR